MNKLVNLILVLLILGVGVWFVSLWWGKNLEPVNTNDKQKKTVVVKSGESLKSIADKLKELNLIKDSLVFSLYVKYQMAENKIQAGVFYLSPDLGVPELLKEMQIGKFDLSVTIPEGLRAEEIAQILKVNMPLYKDGWRGKLVENEGYLFPDTYFFHPETDIDDIISILKKNFEKKYTEVKNNTNLGNSDILIIASLIEREAKHDVDRPLVSSVIHNRLEIGMKLDLDATIQYAIGYSDVDKRWWKKSLTQSDLKLDSLYNTYLNAGLTPGPISNPGLASLQAAANPAKTNYFYYVSDQKGVNHYATTIEEHNNNIKLFLR